MLSTALVAATLAAYFLDAPNAVIMALFLAAMIAIVRELIQAINMFKEAKKL